MSGVEVRREVHWVVGSGVRRVVHREAGVRREVGCRRHGSGGRCFMMRAVGFWWEVLQDAGSGSQASCESGSRGQA
jgi:hypothetical protein